MPGKPLGWDISGVKDFENLYVDDGKGGRELNPISNAIIYGTMLTGIPVLTLRNGAEFHFRLTMAELVHGSLIHRKSGEPYRISLQDIVRHVGLKTNVHRLSETQFLESLWRTWKEKVRPQQHAEVEALRMLKKAREEQDDGSTE